LPQFFKPLDWTKLAKKEIEPPYKPTKTSTKTDVTNFDPEFLEMSVENTPVDPEDIEDIDQQVFKGFSFLATTSNTETEPVRWKMGEAITF
jgi:hypothetical protein